MTGRLVVAGLVVATAAAALASIVGAALVHELGHALELVG